MKIINSIWFTQCGRHEPIGIVIVDFEKGGDLKAYIGVGFGHDQKRDEIYIAETGSKFPLHLAMGFGMNCSS